MSRKIGSPTDGLYGRWLEQVFKHVKPSHNTMTQALQAITKAGTPICTLNYDTLLEAVTNLDSLTFGDPKVVAS